MPHLPSSLAQLEEQYNRVRDIHAIRAINKATMAPLQGGTSGEFDVAKEAETLKQNQHCVLYCILRVWVARAGREPERTSG
jgi:hypothetical protein